MSIRLVTELNALELYLIFLMAFASLELIKIVVKIMRNLDE